MYSFTGTAPSKANFLIFQKVSGQTKVTNENTESINRVLYKL